MECMACSDNTIRAGLTDKFKDVDTLCRSLTYTARRPHRLQPVTVDRYTSLYAPESIHEFAVHRIEIVGELTAEYALPPVATGSILIVIKGAAMTTNGQLMSRGNVFYVEPNLAVNVKEVKEKHWLAFRAFEKTDQ